MDARRFFETALPHFVGENISAFLSMRGTIAFSVGDAGSWTVRLGHPSDVVRREFADDAGLKLWFQPAAFEAFLGGTLDVGASLDSGALAFSGDAGLFEKIGILLQPPTSMLGVRSGTKPSIKRESTRRK